MHTHTTDYTVARAAVKKSTMKKAKTWWNSLDGTRRANLKKGRNLSNDEAIRRFWLANISTDHLENTDGAN